MKKTICMIICMVSLMCVFCGCQKTPEEPIVIGKNQETMIEKAEEPLPTEKQELPLINRYEVKERLQKTVNEMDGKLVIEVDAEVSVPNTDEMPIMKIVPANFSQEEVSRIVKSS